MSIQLPVSKDKKYYDIGVVSEASLVKECKECSIIHSYYNKVELREYDIQSMSIDFEKEETTGAVCLINKTGCQWGYIYYILVDGKWSLDVAESNDYHEDKKELELIIKKINEKYEHLHVKREVIQQEIREYI